MYIAISYTFNIKTVLIIYLISINTKILPQNFYDTWYKNFYVVVCKMISPSFTLALKSCTYITTIAKEKEQVTVIQKSSQ